MKLLCVLTLLALTWLMVAGCQSLSVEAGFKQPIELTATAEAEVAHLTLAPNPDGAGTNIPAASTLSPVQSIASDSAHVTYQPAMPGNPTLTLEDARARVRTFLGQPDAALEGYLAEEKVGDPPPSRHLSAPVIDRKVFYVQRQVPGVRYPDQFVVDGQTGEVIEATLSGNTLPTAPRRPVTDGEAKTMAEDFARTRFAAFDRLALREAGVGGATSTGSSLYSLRWQQRAPDAGPWLPVWVWVDVDLETGRVFRYTAGRSEYQGPLTPKIGQKEAIDIALAEARRDTRLARVTVGQVELRAGNTYGQPRLTWFLGLDGVPDSVGVHHFDVDALSGQILNPLGSPLG